MAKIKMYRRLHNESSMIQCYMNICSPHNEALFVCRWDADGQRPRGDLMRWLNGRVLYSQ